jgi:proteasome accessory factor B
MKTKSESIRQAGSLVTDPTSSSSPSSSSSSGLSRSGPARRRGPILDRRTTWERLSQIDEWIASGTYPNCRSMALKLGVTERTVTRDLEFMKNKRNLPIKYDPRRYGFYYSEPVRGFPKTPMTEADIFAIMVAHKSVAQYRGTPFEKPLRVAFQKLTGQLDNRRLHSIANLRGVLSFRPFAPEDSDLRVFKTLTKAIAKRRELKFRYRNHDDNRIIPRTVQPYHLTCFDTRWYLVGYALERREVRTYSLSRLSDPQLLQRTFKRPKNFDPDKYFGGSIGVMKGDQDYEVIIDFDRAGADLIHNRRWHATQELTRFPDGSGCRLKMRLTCLEEIERAILSWGTHAKVLAPDLLRRRLASVGSYLTRTYRDSSSSSPSSSSSIPRAESPSSINERLAA